MIFTLAPEKKLKIYAIRWHVYRSAHKTKLKLKSQADRVTSRTAGRTVVPGTQ